LAVEVAKQAKQAKDFIGNNRCAGYLNIRLDLLGKTLIYSDSISSSLSTPHPKL
jgi:hypothetical protein